MLAARVVDLALVSKCPGSATPCSSNHPRQSRHPSGSAFIFLLAISPAFFLLIGSIQNGFQRFEEYRLEPDLVRSQGRVPEGAEWYDALFAAQWKLKGIQANAGDRLAVMNYTEMEAKVCFSNDIATEHYC